MTCFQETGSEVLGVSAQELGEMEETDYDQVFQRINFKEFVFKIRAKMDVFNVSLTIVRRRRRSCSL